MADVEKVRPHKVTSAWGTAALYSAVFSVPAVIIRVTKGKNALTAGLTVASVIGFVVGAFTGWGRASKEETYINTLEQQNAALLNNNQNIGLHLQAAMQNVTPTAFTPDMSAVTHASELAASPVSIEEPTIKEPVIKTPVVAPAPTTKSFAENAPAPAHEHGGHAAAVEASQHAAAQAEARL